MPDRNSIGMVIELAAAVAASSSFTKCAIIIPSPVKHIVPAKMSPMVVTSGTNLTW